MVPPPRNYGDEGVEGDFFSQQQRQERVPSGNVPFRATAIAITAVLVITIALLNGASTASSPSASLTSVAEECVHQDKVKIYKYTIASSKAEEDGAWAEKMFGCTVRDVTDTHGCATLGKTSCLQDTLGYNLHFVTNSITAAGDKDIQFWDDVMTAEHGNMDKFDPFMDYRMVFYAQDLSELTKSLMDEGGESAMLRSAENDGGETWYSLLLQSPSGKIFEVVSTKLDLEKLASHKAGEKWLKMKYETWAADELSCPHTQVPTLDLKYTARELDVWAETLGAQGTSLLPIRNQIAGESNRVNEQIS